MPYFEMQLCSTAARHAVLPYVSLHTRNEPPHAGQFTNIHFILRCIPVSRNLAAVARKLAHYPN
jgi:hypothetical protein